MQHPRIAFADDLAAVFLNVVSGMGPLMNVFVILPMATGLHLHISKIAVVTYSAYFDIDLGRRLHELIGSSALAVRRAVRDLNVPLLPSADQAFWDYAPYAIGLWR